MTEDTNLLLNFIDPELSKEVDMAIRLYQGDRHLVFTKVYPYKSCPKQLWFNSVSRTSHAIEKGENLNKKKQYIFELELDNTEFIELLISEIVAADWKLIFDNYNIRKGEVN